MSSNILKYTLLSLTIGYVTISIENKIESNFFEVFLGGNLISLLVALLAINITTLGIILTKIRDILDKNNLDGSYFKKTKQQMLIFIKEQLSLILFSAILLIVKKSILIKDFTIIEQIINIFLTACFIYAIFILYDAAKSIFNLLDF